MNITESPEISGLLYKKRGGFGKMMPNAWQYRFFTISKDGVFCYFDTESDIFESKARGKIDLRAVNYELVTDHPMEGAPHPFVFLVSPSNDEKWKLCAERKEDFNRWCKVLEKYATARHLSQVSSMASLSSDELDGKPYQSLGKQEESSFGSAISTHGSVGTVTGGPRNALIMGSTQDSEQTTATGPGSSDNSHASGDRSGSIGAMATTSGSAGDAAVSLAASTIPSVSTVADESAGGGGSMGTYRRGRKRGGLKTAAGDKSIISQEMIEWIVVLIIVTLCFISNGLLWSLQSLFYVTIANVVVGYTLYLRGQRTAAAVRAARAAQEQSDSPTAAVAVVRGDEANHKVVASITQPKQETAPETVAASDSGIVAADTSVLSMSTAAAPLGAKPTPGFTFSKVAAETKPAAEHSWCPADPRLFNVRIGPDYSRNKMKAPSAAALYEPFAVDVFCAKLRVDHAATRFNLPDTSHLETHHPHVPPLFIIQIQIPSEAPASLFSSADDGPGWSIVMYYRISERTRQELRDLSTASPAVRLFAQWCEKAPIDPAWRARFKVIASCTNLEELGMPSAVTSWNAKPVLIRRTGTIFKGANYLEMDIHVHKFANLAKQSIFLISSRCGLMFMQIGFVIEGRTNEELPETLFACVAVNKPQEDRAEFLFDDDEDDEAA